MKKILLIALSLLLVMGLMAGCAPKESETGETPPVVEDDNKEDVKLTGSVTVYTPHNAEVVNPIVKKFEDETGIKVDIVAAGTGELLKRIEAESSNPLGDVLWGGGSSRYLMED